MNFRNASVRAVRTFCQTLAGGLSTLAIVNITDLKLAGDTVLVMMLGALLTATITFLQNVAEDSTDVHIPK